MVQDDLPACRFLLENQREDARRIAAAGSAAGQMKVPGHNSVLGTQHAHGEVRKLQMSHGLTGRILFPVSLENASVAVLDGGPDECGLRGIGISLHERDNVS